LLAVAVEEVATVVVVEVLVVIDHQLQEKTLVAELQPNQSFHWHLALPTP
jgi:hypothetical protein